jgi:excisionase family DNA binding protein
MDEKVLKPNESVGLMDVKQAASYLNIKISTLYSFCMKRQIPFVKLGKLNRFRMSDLNKWVDEHIQRGLGQ